MCATCAGILLLSASSALAQNRAVATQPETIQNVQSRVLAETQKITQLQTIAETNVSKMRDNAQKVMSEIRDMQKQRIAQQIDKQITDLNKTWTDHFTNVLNQLEMVLQKIQTRTDKAKTKGRDTSAVDAAILTARTEIQVARDAVTVQAAKTYIIDITAVTTGTTTPTASTPKDQEQIMKNLRTQFRAVKDQLQKDLMTLRDGVVKDARSSVQNSLKVLSQVPGVDNSK